MRKYLLPVSAAIILGFAIASHASLGEIPAVGSPAPAFKLTTNEGKKISLTDYKGKWVVLYFCSMASFGGKCADEARNFQRDFKQYEQANAVILGVTMETVERNRDFCSKEGLSFNLLTDRDAKVAQEYGSAFGPKSKPYDFQANTFIIDPQGKIAKVFPEDSFMPSEKVLAALTEIQK